MKCTSGKYTGQPATWHLVTCARCRKSRKQRIMFVNVFENTTGLLVWNYLQNWNHLNHLNHFVCSFPTVASFHWLPRRFVRRNRGAFRRRSRKPRPVMRWNSVGSIFFCVHATNITKGFEIPQSPSSICMKSTCQSISAWYNKQGCEPYPSVLGEESCLRFSRQSRRCLEGQCMKKLFTRRLGCKLTSQCEVQKLTLTSFEC